MTLLSQIEEYFGFRLPFPTRQGSNICNTNPPIKVDIYLPKAIIVEEYELLDNANTDSFMYIPTSELNIDDLGKYMEVFTSPNDDAEGYIVFFLVNGKTLEPYQGILPPNMTIGYVKFAHYYPDLRDNMYFARINKPQVAHTVGHALINTEAYHNQTVYHPRLGEVSSESNLSFYPTETHSLYCRGQFRSSHSEVLNFEDKDSHIVKTGIPRFPDCSYTWQSLDANSINNAVKPDYWAVIPKLCPGYYNNRVSNCSEFTTKLLYQAGLDRYDRTQLFYIRYAFLGYGLVLVSRSAWKNSANIHDLIVTILYGLNVLATSSIASRAIGSSFETGALALLFVSLITRWDVPLNNTKLLTVLSSVAVGGAIGGAINGGFETREWSRSIAPYLPIPTCIQAATTELVGVIGAFFGTIASIIPISDHTCNNLVIFPAQLDLLLSQCKAVEARLTGIKDNNLPKSDSPKMDVAKNVVRTAGYLVGGFFAINAMRNFQCFDQGVTSVCESLSIPTLPTVTSVCKYLSIRM